MQALRCRLGESCIFVEVLLHQFCYAMEPRVRQRDVLPLPTLAVDNRVDACHGRRGRQRVQRGTAWRRWANDGIAALNQLSGHSSSVSAPPGLTASAAQASAIDHISRSYQHFPLPPEYQEDHRSGEAALTELLAAAPGYSSEAQRVKPYNKDLVSWPDLSTPPVEVTELVGEAERECLSGWRRTMLKGESSTSVPRAASVPQRPYVDPILANNPRAYAGFVGELLQGGMISFRVARAADPYSLGFFFVKKVGKGSLRLVFDTRVANEGFVAPPKTTLPTAAAWAALEAEHPVVLAQGDIQCAFYHMLVPKGMEELFTLPTISNRLLNIKQIDGQPVPLDCILQPRVRVLPMGWNWSLLFCQSLMRRALVHNGFGDGDLIEDGRPSPVLRDRTSVAAAGYVDNFAIVGGDAEVVTAKRDAVTRTLEAWGLPVHSIDVASSVSVFTGLEINGDLGTVRVKPSSVMRLRQALLAVLRRGAASPRMLEVLLGHVTWAMICKRETLSILSSVYAFKSLKDPGVRPLWGSVKFELWCVASTLPLWTSHVNIPWGSHVSASDASPIGIGVCTRRLEGPQVADIGRQAEKWRYRCTSAVSARANALGLEGPHDASDLLEDLATSDPVGFNKGFNEIPEELMQAPSWATVISRRHWNPVKNILEYEGDALCDAVRHATRNVSLHHHRHLFLVDNLPLALAAGKGRGRKPTLRRPLRRLAALTLATNLR